MTSTPTKIIVDCTTGETNEVPLTAEEIAGLEMRAAQLLADQEAREVEEARIAALKVSARQKLVTGEKLTEEEAALLVI